MGGGGHGARIRAAAPPRDAAAGDSPARPCASGPVSPCRSGFSCVTPAPATRSSCRSDASRDRETPDTPRSRLASLLQKSFAAEAAPAGRRSRPLPPPPAAYNPADSTRWEKRGPAPAAEGAIARNRSGAIPPRAGRGPPRRHSGETGSPAGPAPAPKGQEAHGGLPRPPRFQTLRQKDRGAAQVIRMALDPHAVIPAEAGIQRRRPSGRRASLDPRLRGDDGQAREPALPGSAHGRRASDVHAPLPPDARHVPAAPFALPARPRAPRRLPRTPHRPQRRRDRAHAARGRPRLARRDDRRHRARPRSSPPRRWRCPTPISEVEALAKIRAHRRPEPGLPQLHRPGLLRHAHAQRHPAQHPREPGLVHRLHARTRRRSRRAAWKR